MDQINKTTNNHFDHKPINDCLPSFSTPFVNLNIQNVFNSVLIAIQTFAHLAKGITSLGNRIFKRQLSEDVSTKPIASSQLTRNLKLANEALHYVQGHIPFSANYPIRKMASSRIRALSPLDDAFHAKYERLIASLDAVRSTTKSEIEQQLSNKPFFYEHLSQSLLIGALSEKYSVGNCQEMSCAAFFYCLRTKGIGAKVDIYQIKNGDHFFLVIGRDINSDPKDYKTWGSSAVICDPWAGKVFLASDLEKKLKNYITTDSTGKPWTEPFSHRRLFFPHSLELDTSNIYTPNDFASQIESNGKHPSILSLGRLLKKFHETTDETQKRALAKEILQAGCNETIFKTEHAVRTLLYQMHLYLSGNRIFKSDAAPLTR